MTDASSQKGYGFNYFKEYVTVDDIFKRVSQEVLWRYYLGHNFKLNTCFSAPYRKDQNPSFNIYLNNNGKILFKDFGRNYGGDIFDYLKLIYNESLQQSIRRIDADFGLNLFQCNKPRITNAEKKKLENFEKIYLKDRSRNIKIQIVPKEFSEQDLRYWQEFGISKKTLEKYNVFCVKKLFLNGFLIYTYNSEDPCFAYYFEKSKHVKCYFPNRKNQRFLGNTNNFEDIQGYFQCDIKNTKPKLLILTKSMKDVMCLNELGFYAMAIHGEEHRFYSDFIRHIKKYCDVIISLYDFDESGVNGAKNLWQTHQIMPYFLPKTVRKNSKDVSDVFKKNGLIFTQSLIQNIYNHAIALKNKRYDAAN